MQDRSKKNWVVIGVVLVILFWIFALIFGDSIISFVTDQLLIAEQTSREQIADSVDDDSLTPDQARDEMIDRLNRSREIKSAALTGAVYVCIGFPVLIVTTLIIIYIAKKYTKEDD